MKSTNYESHIYAVFSILLSLPLLDQRYILYVQRLN